MRPESKTISELVERIKERLGGKLVSIVMFGSRARGNYGKRSDVDLLVIADKLPESAQDRWDMLRSVRLEVLLESGMKVETLLLTKKEVLDNLNCFSPLFSSFVIGNVVLYDTDFIAQKLENFTRNLSKTKIKYYEGGRKWDIQRISSKISQ